MLFPINTFGFKEFIESMFFENMCNALTFIENIVPYNRIVLLLTYERSKIHFPFKY